MGRLANAEASALRDDRLPDGMGSDTILQQTLGIIVISTFKEP